MIICTKDMPTTLSLLDYRIGHVLIYLLLTHHTSMIISPRQRHHHHSCHQSPHHSFIPISKLFFFSNLILHSHLARLRTDSTVIRTCSRSFQFFFRVLVFIIILHFLPFQFFSYFSCLYLIHFSNFCQFYI